MAQTSGWETLDSRQGDKGVKPVEEEPPAQVKAYVEQTGGGTGGYDQQLGVPIVNAAPWQAVDVGGLGQVVQGIPEYELGEAAGAYETGIAAGDNDADSGLEG
jgi:hypothetical protein